MKNQMLNVRLPPEIVYGIDEFQRKHNLTFRTDALIEIVKVACSAVGIDLSDIPAAPALPTQATEEQAPGKWPCSINGRIGDYLRCERKIKKQPEECKKWYNNLGVCKGVPKYYWSILFEVEEGEEEEAEEEPEEEASRKPITQKNTSIPEEPSTAIVPPKPQEPSVDQPGMKASKTDVYPDIEVQPAAIIKGLRERSVSKPKTRGQQTLGDEGP